MEPPATKSRSKSICKQTPRHAHYSHQASQRKVEWPANAAPIAPIEAAETATEPFVTATNRQHHSSSSSSTCGYHYTSGLARTVYECTFEEIPGKIH
jgi:hypothetical protein